MIPTRYQEPWQVLSQLQRDINNMLNSTAADGSSSATADWVPSVDITEYHDRFELQVDVPGIDVKDVDITLEGGVLTLSGERRFEKAADDDSIMQHRSERGIGKFYRRFTLPDTVDADKVKASGQNGVLLITIPKQPKAQPRRIKVNS